ncbi:MAG: aminotransferase class IV family protein [Chitinophagaceae bacterium]|nr:aminotransferase class IV family protein [Oligoflexus sp.]
MSSYVMINGIVHPESEAMIPALDRGFLYGDCIYEIFAAKNGVLIDFERHMERLRNSARIHEIPVPWSNEILQFDIDHLLSAHPSEYTSLRLVVSRGIGGPLIPLEALKPERYLYAKPIPFPLYKPDSEGVKLKSKRHPAHQRDDVTKTNNYLNTISASAAAAREGFDDILWLSADGELLETGLANVFFLSREGDLVEIATPPLASGILPGITRARTIELLTSAKIPVTERPIMIEELPRFDEAFITSSLRLLRPVSLVDKHRLHSCRKNAVFWHIHRLFNSWLSQAVLNPSSGAEKH